MLPNLNKLSHDNEDVNGKYTLFGNEKSDWGILNFDDYDRYLERFNEWQRIGWIRRNEVPSERHDGPGQAQRVSPNAEKNSARVYTLMTRPDFKTYKFKNYDEYIREWELAKQNKTLFAPTIKELKNGDVVQYKNGAWRLVPLA